SSPRTGILRRGSAFEASQKRSGRDDSLSPLSFSSRRRIMSNWFSKLRRDFQRRLRASRPRRSRAGTGHAAIRPRLELETLEVRVVPSANDWAMYNHDASGLRDNTAERILSPSNVGNLHVLWSFPTAGPVAGTPAVVDNVVYAGDRTGMFYAVSSDGT